MPIIDEGIYLIKSVSSGKVIDLTGGQLQNGVPLQQFDENGGANQHWKLILQP